MKHRTVTHPGTPGQMGEAKASVQTGYRHQGEAWPGHDHQACQEDQAQWGTLYRQGTLHPAKTSVRSLM